MQDHIFDPEFTDKLKEQFSRLFRVVQKDSALRGLEMVFKDTQFSDVAIQANKDDIDADLMKEIKFYKTEIGRLQGELNSMQHKMNTNEKTVKQAQK